jgi:hypothetical protein
MYALVSTRWSCRSRQLADTLALYLVVMWYVVALQSTEPNSARQIVVRVCGRQGERNTSSIHLRGKEAHSNRKK